MTPSAFVVSTTGTETLQQQLLLRSLAAGTSDTTVVSTRDIWSSVCNLPGSSGTAAYKQSAWDKMIVASEHDSLLSSLSDTTDKARLLTVTSPHSGDWLHALPLSSCGLRLDDNAVHVVVGANICEPHQCPCGTEVDARGFHGLSCKGGSGRSAQHHSLNDLVWQWSISGTHSRNQGAIGSSQI